MKNFRLLAAAAAVLAFASCQKEAEPEGEISVVAREVTVGAKAQETPIAITANNSWAAYVEEDWLSVNPEAGEAGENVMITISIAANTEEEGRSALIKFTCKNATAEFTVNQLAYDPLADAVNLSLEGTANCYIVAPGAKAYFTGNVKGNSEESVGEVADVKLVWQSEKGLVKSLAWKSAANAVLFECGDVSGNAVVAVADAAGAVLWSWHLWVTDYNPAESLYTTEANASGTTWSFMDRNLGATSMEKGTFDKNAGLIYQWGRKDPFPSAVSYTVQNYDYSYEADGEPAVYDIDGNELPKVSSKAAAYGSVALGIANPDVFYKVVSVNTGKQDEDGSDIYENVPRSSDWSDTSDDDAWGGVSMKKSVYDPCPAGYKVPVCDADGNTPYAWMVYKEMEWDTTYYGAMMNGQWFPTIGTRVYASGGLNYPEANPYSGMWIGTAGKANADLDTYPTLYGQYMFIINGKRTFKVNKDCRSQGLNVRCVAE